MRRRGGRRRKKAGIVQAGEGATAPTGWGDGADGVRMARVGGRGSLGLDGAQGGAPPHGRPAPGRAPSRKGFQPSPFLGWPVDPAADPLATGPPATGPRSAAFFDFDRTLLHGDAGVIFGWTLVDYGFGQGKDLPPKARKRHNRQFGLQMAGILGKGLAYKGLHAIGVMKRSRLVELTYRFLAGLPAHEMSARMERVWNEKLRERLYPRMMEVIEEHRKAGRRIVIVTTGLRELVEHSKRALGEDVEVIGVEMRADEGMWLGHVEGPLYGVHKAAAVAAYAARNGIDLSQSWAYSDHFSDTAFLACVGHPVAVNPDFRLRLYAKKKGWQIIQVLPPSGVTPQPAPAP